MPGRISMDQHGAVGSLDLKKDRSNAQIAQPSAMAQPPAKQHANGVVAPAHNGSLPNGVASHETTPATTNGKIKSSTVQLSDPSNPPPLDQSWREQPTNKSLGKLISRVSQQCFVDLNETLSNMSAVEDEAQRPQTNIASQPALDTSEASLKKKRMLMEFANKQRDRFIKTLVLTDASQNRDEQARLLDVKIWQDKQLNSYNWAMDSIKWAKLDMNDVKLPSPNIEGAMEALSTGKSSRMPHLGYVPPKKASAKELLKTLRDMNVIIATRLSLHDELSPHMQDYTVGDGRVTFKVTGEFEVDLAVGDDDPESQFFFLDLRLAFRPSTGAISDVLRGHLESRVNQALLEKGLSGCYDFLHNFVLTHKVNVLRSQVAELTQGKWFECIRAENLRRSLTVQYWVGKPGPKSWLDFGIGSGKVKGVRSTESPTSCLSVRWFRHGKEVKDEPLYFDWDDLSLERYLSTAIEKHTTWMVDEMRSRVAALLPAGSPVVVQVPEKSSQDMHLALSLPSLSTSLEVHVGAVTGQYSFSPLSGPSARAERHLNNDAAADPAQWLANTLCAVAQEQVHKSAELLQWAPVPRLARQDNLQKIFGNGIYAHSSFLPSKAWGELWALAVTFSLGGPVWWAVLLEDRRDDQSNVVGRIIGRARRIGHAQSTIGPNALSRATLLQIEKSAVAEVASAVLSAQLAEMAIPYRFYPAPPRQDDGGEDVSNTAGSIAAMFFDPGELLKQPNCKRPSWAGGLARLIHHGMVEHGAGEAGVRHDLRLSLEADKMKQLQKRLTNFKDRSLVLSENGAVSLRILTPFGKPFAGQIRSRLQNIERLDRCIFTLHKYGLQCTHVSLTRLTFTYSKEPELSATLLFPADAKMPTRLKLQPSDLAPHTRIKALLETGLNETAERGVGAVGFMLILTLPLLQAFDRIETSSKAGLAVIVQPQTSTVYLLKYTSPLLDCTFDIRSRWRKEGEKKVAYWHIKLTRGDASLPDNFTQALSQELWQAKGEHWRGVGNGVTATAQGIGSAMDKLDEVVRRFEADAPKGDQSAASAPPEQSVKDQNKSAPAQNGQQQQRPPDGHGLPAVKTEKPDVIMLD